MEPTENPGPPPLVAKFSRLEKPTTSWNTRSISGASAPNRRLKSVRIPDFIAASSAPLKCSIVEIASAGALSKGAPAQRRGGNHHHSKQRPPRKALGGNGGSSGVCIRKHDN
jgi:hypothetical protein